MSTAAAIAARPARHVVRAMSPLAATAVCLAIAAAYWVYWTLFPALTAGAIGNDALFLADGARRIAAGEVLHVDFSVPTGAEPYASYYFAERFLPGFSPFIGSHLVGFALISPLIVAAASQFESRLAAMSLGALAAVMALLPFNELPTVFYGLSFHASYNRLGSAFALVYLAWIFRAAFRPSLMNGLLLGYALLFAASLKIVFVGVVLAPFVVLAMFDPGLRRAGVVAAIVVALALTLLQATTGMPAAYLADLRAMSAVNAGRAPYLAASFVFRNFVELGLVTVALGLASARRVPLVFSGRGPALDRLRPLVEPAALFAAFAALVLAESQATGGLEATSALGLLFAPIIAERSSEASLRLVPVTAASALIGGGLIINAFENVGGILLKRKGPVEELAWASRFMPHIVVPREMREEAEALDLVSEAAHETPPQVASSEDKLVSNFTLTGYLATWRSVDLALAKLGDARNLGTVMTLSGVDLFGLALKAPPTLGLKVVHDVGRTIRPLSEDEARVYLAPAQTVFEPTCKLVEAPKISIAPWFAPVLKAEFTARPLTPCWTMHRRKPTSGENVSLAPPPPRGASSRPRGR